MKKQNNKGLLTIQISNKNTMEVIFEPVNNTVWMDRNELPKLLGCFTKDIDRCLGEIFEKNMLRVEDTCKYHIIAGGKRISYDITDVNLTVIITMAFRLETSEAKILRMWFVEQFTKIKSIERLFSDTGELFRLN